MKKDALLGFDLLIHTLFRHKTTGPEQGAERGILREKKSSKKGVSCFVYTYEEKNEALLTMHKRLNKIVAPSLLEKVLFPRMEDCLMSTAIFRTRDGQAIAVSAVCDGGDQGCGGGLLLLMLQAMKRLEPGAVLEVRSTDLGVREDLPAWCRMTGNALLAEQEGERRNRYFLRKA
jgi:TusA-related sulfurtransferase